MKTAIGLMMALLLLEAGAVEAQQKTDIAWGGSSPGGVMYYMVGTAGTVISRELPQYNVTQISTGGSVENAKRLIKGELDMGIVYGAHVYMGLRQEGPFKNGPKATMFRGVAKAYEGPTYFITLPNSGVKKITDLKGKTVALGPPGSGTVFNCTNMLTSLGMIRNIKPRMMTFADAGRALGNRQIDAFCQSSAPAAAVKELAETKGVNILPYTKTELNKITSEYPFYTRGILKKGVYKGVPDTPMPFLTVYWVAHERVSAKAVQDIVALAYRPKIHKELASGHRAWAQMAPDTKNFLKLGAPMHPGAMAYYKSKGQWEE